METTRSFLDINVTQGYNYKIVLHPLNAELNPICHLLALLGAHHIFHVSRIRVKVHKNALNNGLIYLFIYLLRVHVAVVLLRISYAHIKVFNHTFGKTVK